MRSARLSKNRRCRQYSARQGRRSSRTIGALPNTCPVLSPAKSINGAGPSKPVAFQCSRENKPVSTTTRQHRMESDRHPIAPRTTARGALSYFAGLIAIGLTYFVLAKGGLALALIHPNASSVWPPTGFALAAIVLWGYRGWPAVFLAAMIANATAAGGSMGTAIPIAIGNTLEALVGAALINLWCNGRDTFSTPNAVAKFTVICSAWPPPSAAPWAAAVLQP